MTHENGRHPAGILTMSAMTTEQEGRYRTEEEILADSSRVLAGLIPVVDRYGGIIGGWQEDRLVVFYEQEPEKALQTVLAVRKEGRRDISAGISYGTVLWGILGYDTFRTRVTLAEEKKHSAFLQSYAGRYAVSVLVTAGYAEQIVDFKKRYTHRLLGNIALGDNEILERVYEVFEGENAERIFLKQKTKMVFEEGVRLFLGKKNAQARRHFIEVLKMDREDKVAREYLRRCEVMSVG